MSAIPSNVASSVLQSGVAQQAQSVERDAAENARVRSARDTGRTVPGDDILEVEATDADTQVHTDSGGMGGQGRHDAPPDPAEDSKPDNGITLDDEGTPHLDLSV